MIVTPYFSKKIVEIPSIHFGVFHPDLVYFSTKAQSDTPQFFMNNPTVSAIGLWTSINKITPYKANQLHCGDVFEALGYMSYFDVACDAICISYR